MTHQTLQYFMHDGPSAFRFELAGYLDSEGARRLEQDWRTAGSIIGDRALMVDITFLTGAEKDGRALLARWHAEGAKFIAKSNVSRELAEAILGGPVGEIAAPGNAAGKWTWLPYHTCSSAAKLHGMLLLAALLLVPMQLHAAVLKAETLTAWDEYVQSVQAGLQDRVRPGGSFLWTAEDPERMAKARDGEIIVAPPDGRTPSAVPGGLIHHWIGAAFLAHAKLNDILEVTHDYDHYKEFYRPFVIESKTVARNDPDDKFSMLLMNRALFVKMAIDADYQATEVRLDDCRFYSVSKTTRVQQIDDYGQPGERRIPEGEGGGYVWKLFSMVRLEERDGGVYIEMETAALSRDIPSLLRPMVNPIVRRLSRNAMLVSIQQTEQAVRSKSLVARSQ
jgi:hypothetical protein